MHIVYCVMYSPHYVMCDEQPMFCMVCDIQPTLYIVWWTTCILYCVVQPHCVPFYVHNRHCIQCDDQPLCILCCVHSTMLYDPHCIRVMYNPYICHTVYNQHIVAYHVLYNPHQLLCCVEVIVNCVMYNTHGCDAWPTLSVVCCTSHYVLCSILSSLYSVQSATPLYAVLFFYEELVWN